MNGGGLFVMALAATVGVLVTAALVIETTVGPPRNKRTSGPVAPSAKLPRRAE